MARPIDEHDVLRISVYNVGLFNSCVLVTSGDYVGMNTVQLDFQCSQMCRVLGSMNIWLQELAVLAAGGDLNVDSPPTLDLREHLVNENNSQRPEQLTFFLVYHLPSDFTVSALIRVFHCIVTSAQVLFLLHVHHLYISVQILVQSLTSTLIIYNNL